MADGNLIKLFGFIIGLFLGILTGLGAGMDVEKAGWQKLMVERGLGLYCPKDGAWAWNGECKDE
jgi:hypothetical protein